MSEDTPLPFELPAVQRKKVTADFAGGSISSDGGLVLLRSLERRLGLAETLAGCIREWRAPARVVHTLPAMLRFRMFAIACGYEDADDCDALRADPLFKLAVGRAPESGPELCSQPTMSRLENAPSRTEAGRLTAALVDLFCRSFPTPPAAITLDIDDTCDAVHGHQQLSLFNAHYDRGRNAGCPAPPAQIRTCPLRHPAPPSGRAMAGNDGKSLLRPRVSDFRFGPVLLNYRCNPAKPSWSPRC